MQLSLKKGSVDHECEPACALHDLEAQGGITGGCEQGRGQLGLDKGWARAGRVVEGGTCKGIFRY